MIRRIPRSRWFWQGASGLAALTVVVPLAVVLSSILRSSDGEWSHLAETRLPDYVLNTVILAVSVCLGSALIGISTAWLTTMYRFPGRGLFRWALLLPLAVPAYLSAYALTDLLQFSGPVQTWLRTSLDWPVANAWFPNLRSLPGAAVILTFALYPYVFFAARVAFQEQSKAMLEASRTLGRGPVATFFRLALPLARPAVVGGTALVLMETVADFGAVDYCAVDTFATGIYRTWFGLESPVAAAQLAALLLGVLFLVLGLEWILRRTRRYHRVTHRGTPVEPTRLGRSAGFAAMALCLLPLMIGFVLPVGRLLDLAVAQGDSRARDLLGELVQTTGFLAAVAAIVAVILAMVLGYARRLVPTTWTGIQSTLARFGYAIPGPVIAIGLLIPLTWLDRRINEAALGATDGSWRPGLILTGSMVGLILAYQTRFLAVALSFIEAGLLRINRRLDEAARMLGRGPLRTFGGIHLPMLRGSLLAAGLLVFVDVVKELPMTLMLRPFNIETLAVRVYQLASDERLEEASTLALAIVVVGLLPVVVLSWLMGRESGTSSRSLRP